MEMQTAAPDNVSPGKIFAWIACLTFTAVGARNFENGMAIDGPTYAMVARNIARSGE